MIMKYQVYSISIKGVLINQAGGALPPPTEMIKNGLNMLIFTSFLLSAFIFFFFFFSSFKILNFTLGGEGEEDKKCGGVNGEGAKWAQTEIALTLQFLSLMPCVPFFWRDINHFEGKCMHKVDQKY